MLYNRVNSADPPLSATSTTNTTVSRPEPDFFFNDDEAEDGDDDYSTKMPFESVTSPPPNGLIYNRKSQDSGNNYNLINIKYEYDNNTMKCLSQQKNSQLNNTNLSETTPNGNVRIHVMNSGFTVNFFIFY